MSLTHTDVQLDKLTINKFETLNDFRAAASAIGENDISIIEEPFNVDWNESDSGSPAYIKNKPVIGDGILNVKKNGDLIGSFSANQTNSMDIDVSVPVSTSQLTNDSYFVSDSAYTHTDYNFDGAYKGKIDSIASGAQVNIQSDWDVTDSGSDAYINNKPFVPESLGDLSDVEISQSGSSAQTYFVDAVEDYDGNKYDAVIIGDQVWMAQNLRATHYADGTSIPNIGSSSYDQTNGLFYRVNAMLNSSSASSDSNPSGIQGISPNGWHIPSVSEWEEMKNYLRTNLPSGAQIGPSLTSETYGGTNLIGFNATADGAFNFTDSSMFQPGSAYYWTTNRENSVQSYIIRILPSGNDIESAYINTILQTHVRCVCDLSANEFRTKMALRGKVLMYNGNLWTDGDIPTQQQSDWNVTDSADTTYIKNKPFIPETLSGLTDVTINLPEDGQLLKYDSLTSGWTNEDAGYIVEPPAPELTDGTIIENIVQDYDGNWYDGVVMGEQIWLAQDLKTTHYSDGTSISSGTITSTNERRFYNWAATMNGSTASSLNPSGVQGVAPNGWHIPSNSEWLQLQNTVTQSNWSSNTSYAPLCSTSGWNNYQGTNESNFNALPGNTFGAFDYAFFQTTDDDGSTTMCYSVGMMPSNGLSNPVSMSKDYYMNVRCVCDLTVSEWFSANGNRSYLKYTSSGAVWSLLSTVAETGSYNDLTDKPEIPSAQVQADWSETDSADTSFIKNKPTIGNGSLTITQNGASAVTFSANQETNVSVDISVPTLRTMNHEQLTDSSLGDINIHDGFYFPNAVQDYDGNWYGAVVIGDQVWLGENLRTTHYADGTAITRGEIDGTLSNSPCYYNVGTSIAFKNRGHLYNWYAVMNGESSSSTNQSGVKGLSPGTQENENNIWHIPSKAEFEQLKNYIGKQKRYLCNNDSNNIAKSLASTVEWSESEESCAIGNVQSLNNKTGFNAFPTGSYGGGTLIQNNYNTYFWSCTNHTTSGKAYSCGLSYSGSLVAIGDRTKNNATSVRCVSDLTPIQFRNWYIEQYGSLQHIIAEDVQEQADWSQTNSADTSYIKNKPTIGDGTLTIQRNGVDVGSFSANQTTDMVINVNVPVSASEVSALPDTTRYAADVSVGIDQSTFVMTMQLKDQLGSNIGSGSSVDLPLESVVVGGSYNSGTQMVVLTLQNGNTVEFSVADLVSGLQSEITSDNKLSADLIKDGMANKVFTAAEQSKLSGIASGAEVNVQSDWNQSNSSSDDFIKNKPTIGDGILNVKRNGNLVGSFSANQSSSMDMDISVPVSTSELTNNSHYVSDSAYTHTDNNFTTDYLTKLEGIASGAQVNVQSDWNESDSASDAYILNKPVIPDISGKADKVTGATNGNLAGLDSNGNLTDSGSKASDFEPALPSKTGNGGKVLAVNSGATGFEYVPILKLTYDNTVTVSSNAASVTFPADSRKYFDITASANMTLNITANNSDENYILISNTGSVSIHVTIGTVSYGNTALTNINIITPINEISCPAGKSVEISAIVFSGKAIISCSGDLETKSAQS